MKQETEPLKMFTTELKDSGLPVLRNKFLNTSPMLNNLDQNLSIVTDRIQEEFHIYAQKLSATFRNIFALKYEQETKNSVAFLLDPATEAGVLDPALIEQMEYYNVKVDATQQLLENCLKELECTLNTSFSFSSLCPSGWTLTQRYENILNKYFKPVPLKKQKTNTSQPHQPTAFVGTVPKTLTEETYQKIQNMLACTGRRLKNATMIFRASQHGFRSKKFKELCSKMEKTMVIVKSNHGRVFGGYTPCKWLDTKEKEYIADHKGESFLFSLESEMVFPIRKHQHEYAISAYGSWGPIFGSPYGPDLSISDQCHLNQHSCSSLGSHYEIPTSIKQFSNEAFSLLAGSKKFKVQDYEVFEVEFQPFENLNATIASQN